MVLVLAIVATIFITYNIAHYRAMQNQVEADHGSLVRADQNGS